ncbi:MAG: glycosyltransferase family 2 protein, partial [Methylobacteriaceae bacterium]|nr:glycosyltransferase family 2 protein [Methylobacteriaceae bacterium]
MPRLRVIASFFNCAEEVEDGLETVRRQSFEDFECIVVDDCSSDATPATIERWLDRTHDPRFRFAPNRENKGIAWVRSHHSRNADTDYLAFQEAGDLSHPDRYRRSVELMRSDDRMGLVGCGFENLVEQTGRAYPRRVGSPAELTFERLIHRNRFAGGELFFATPALRAVGGIIDDLPFGEDYYAILRVARRFRVGYLPDLLYTRRVSLRGLSYRPDSFVRQCWCVLAVRDLAAQDGADVKAFLAARGGLESYRRDPRLRRLLVRGAVRSALI